MTTRHLGDINMVKNFDCGKDRAQRTVPPCMICGCVAQHSYDNHLWIHGHPYYHPNMHRPL